MIKLIASDMDGSLLDENSKLPVEFFSILDEMTKKGIKFVAASGRPYYTLYDNFSPRSDDIIYIADNGACVVMNGKVIYKKTLDKKEVNNIVKQCQELKINNIYIVLCGSCGAYVLDDTPAVIDEIDKYYSKRFIINDVDEIDDDIYKIGIYDLENAAENSYKKLYPILKDQFDMVISGKVWMDIMIKGVNKGEALYKLKQKLSVSHDETMAFGDYYNDIEMLSRARHSFVMANANDDMKQYGKYIAKSNRENGVIKAIMEYALSSKIRQHKQ